ncbi:hypothetical protein FOVG_19546 [Fusarium oxysporum f. sp. pisi HDV247]|uniref:Zn(2)-C6 fungal-type domain-containing protein n=1 Tax=Fusarium oxysporum f. sp. pisi HDV247 TaxID=1080344 RepID=W9N842_FUSOX|nr:hypothetical protein FOVG_19546 [Fusarium oxysporum f. sp. pisi HDV247]
MKRCLPVLLAKPPENAAQLDAQSDEKGEFNVSKPLKRRRVAVKVACNRCRQRKTQCDGQRPTCSSCMRTGVDCQYDQTGANALAEKNEELQQELKTLTALVDRLRNSSEEDAFSLIRQLKTTPDVSEILASVREPPPIKQPSSHQCALAILPPTQSFVEYELTILHDFSYPALEPIELPEIDLDRLEKSNWPKSTTSIDDKVLADLDSMPGSLKSVVPSQLNAIPQTAFPGSPKSPSVVIGPSPPLRWCDSRLNRLNINYWTRVPISNELAAGAISTYLETDHALLGFFDADLFLSDLVEQRLNYCSPFLVSSLLCMACLCYTAIDEKAAALSHVFQREAEQLRYAYRGSDTITTLSALSLCSIACTWLGKDKLGQDLLKDSRAMAERLQLFGSQGTDAVETKFLQMTSEQIRATSHAAWGSYSYITFHATMYGGEPIACPPVLPLPGEGSWERSDTNDARWPVHSLPAYMGCTFTAMCRLWSIVQEVLIFYNIPPTTAPVERTPLSFAEQKYQKLLSWADTLSSELARNSHRPLHVYIFHTMYHIAVLNIFRPLLPTSGRFRLRSFASSDSSPVSVCHASFQQLKRLLVEAMTRPRYSIQSGLLNPAVMHISNIILAHSDRRNYRHYLLLCMSFWIDATPSFPVLADIARAYLSLALRDRSLSAQDARILKQKLTKIREQYSSNEVSSVIVDFDCATAQGASYRANELAQKFDEYAMFEEFTNNSVS